jgi:hypothetical protein
MRKFRPTMVILILLATVVGVATLQPGAGAGADPSGVVDAGYDLLETGSPTQLEFGGSSGIAPIPADFFGPGSDPFEGTVALQGDPFDDFDPGTGTISGLSPTDTIIERQQDAGGGGFPDTIDIEIVALSLVSTAPIWVTTPPGPEMWNVRVDVPASGAQDTGTMTIRHEHVNGGTFDSELPVKPVVTFTKVSDPSEVRVLDWTLEGLSAIVFFASGVDWCHTANPLDSPAGNWVIEKDGLTTNFFPGVDCSTTVGSDLTRNKDYYTQTTADGLSAHTVRPAELPETNYECFDIIPPEPLGLDVILQTQFGTEEVGVGPAKYLCPPALKNDLGDPTATHLKCYDILGAGDPEATVDLETQFGIEEDVQVGPGRMMCMPTVKTPLSPEPGPPSGPLLPSPHYECFEIIGTSPGDSVILQTQFRTEEVPVLAPQYLCAPALKNGEGDLDAPHLKCYDIFTDGPPVGWTVELQTQFSPPNEIVTVNQAHLLCVPVAKTVIGTPGECPNPGAWPWPVPAGDADCDGWTTTLENTISTDPNDGCPDDSSDDAWPPDVTNDTNVNVLDLSTVGGTTFGKSEGQPGYWARADVTGDKAVNVLDLSTVGGAPFGQHCTN